MIRKKIKYLYKVLIQKFFFFLYGKVSVSKLKINKSDSRILNPRNNSKYKIYEIEYARIFTDNNEKIIYNHINEFVSNYSSLPSKEAIAIELSDEKINDEDYKTSVNLLNEISKESDEYTELGWLLDTT